MSTHDNIKLIQSIYDAVGRGDMEHILASLDLDIDWIVPGPTQVLPWCGSYRGRDDVRRYLGLVDRHLMAHRVEPEQFVAQDDTVVVIGHEQHTLKATGRDFASPWVHVFTVRDGKITGLREFNDNLPAVEASRPG